MTRPIAKVNPTKRPDRTHWLIGWIAAATLLGALLRFHELGQPSFWHDELMTIRDVADPSRKHVTRRLGYVHTAIGLRLAGVDLAALPADAPDRWQAHGINEWSARLGSCIVGIVTIAVIGWTSRRILEPRAAAILAFLLAIGTWHLYWSQTARFYPLQFLFISLAIIYYFDATRRGVTALLLAAMVTFALAFWSHWMALLFGGVVVLDLIISTWRGERVRLGRVGWLAIGLALGGAVAIAAYVIIENPESIRFFMHTDPQSPTTLILGTVYLVGIPLATMAGVGAWLMFGEDARKAIYLVLVAIVPALLLSVLSLADVYVHLRYGFICYFGWLALAAYGVERLVDALEPRLGRAVAWSPLVLVAAMILLTNVLYFQSGGGYHPRWREAFAYIAQHRQPGEQVYVTAPDAFLSRYYLQSPDAGRRFPRSAAALNGTAWLVAHTDTASFGKQHRWLHEAADLRAYFDVRLAQPYAGISVFLYTPAPSEMEP